jgi:heterodisulfide reductase subunit D
MNLGRLSAKQLLEIDACTRCGDCLKLCPVYSQRGEEAINPRGKIRAMKKFIRSQHGLRAKLFGPKRLSEDQLKKFSDMVYRCTLCGECGLGCPVSIDSRNLWLALREVLVDQGYFPQQAGTLMTNVLREHNILGQENTWRTEWLESMRDVPEHRYQKERAEVVFFVGCVSAYFPMVYKVTQSFVEILSRANVDFTLLGAEEWCCGFPLIGAGMRTGTQELIQHNLEKVREKGAQRVVFACPSCYHTWHEEYNTELLLHHATQFIPELIREGKIQFREEKVRVTYHDPCDLGRVSGLYEPPREILRAMPGVELVEMADHAEHCKCCGGGGNLEMVDSDLSAALAREKIKQIQATGTSTVITACQQCVRTIMTTARREKIPIKAFSITEFVLKQMK